MKTLVTVLMLCIASLVNAQKLTMAQWQQDLKVYQEQLEVKHIDLYNKISKPEFDATLKNIESSLDTATDFEVMAALMKLTHRIGDGHTSISLWNQDMHYYPIGIYKFGNKWLVTATTTADKAMLGAELTAINNIPVDEVAHKLAPYYQFVENSHSNSTRFVDCFNHFELLQLLGITKKEATTFTFISKDGTPQKITLEPLKRTEYDEVVTQSLVYSIPQIAAPVVRVSNGFWAAPITNTNAVYIYYRNYPTFEEMQQFGEQLVGYCATNNIRKVVIDMRQNWGGDLFVGLTLAYVINLADGLDFKNGMYVLSDHKTFSAATINTAQYRALLNATIVGLPTGSNPVGYQDMSTFELPNSALKINYSKRYFKLQETATDGVQPDIEIPYDPNKIAAGIDNMLAWLYNNKLKE
ncbi:S41 family peptidase [Neptunitalea lumnitzerae]|uniref:Tail specific protease domain-containing protein n=1 Tax=Neptunitalea lumnitzerae TaxID=2965509 RepID=A0ABQ5MEY6_9FLAO|nr:S41 family peptidase [Neptunitalea sp. Y10]GLB47974.1 hypothetical protein Y10_03420 [Neptunitalea sp. Y10]